MIVIQALGQFAVHRDGRSLKDELRRKRRLVELLQAVIASGGRDVPGSSLSATIWQGADGDHAYRSLETGIHRLRELLGREAIVVADKTISLSESLCVFDVWDLGQALQRLAAVVNDDGASIVRLQAAANNCIAHYPGPLLPSSDSPWIRDSRERLQSRVLRQCLDAVAVLRDHRAHHESVQVLRNLLDIGPGLETVYRDLICGYKALGHSADAADVFRRCTEYFCDARGQPLSEDTIAAFRSD